MTLNVLVNLTGIDFSKTLGVWLFGRYLIHALGQLQSIRTIGMCPRTTVVPDRESSVFSEIAAGSENYPTEGVELLLHHFQVPMTSLRRIVIIHDLHLWDVPWKYGDAKSQIKTLVSLMEGVSAVLTHFPRTYFDLPRLLPNVPNALFLTTSPTMQPYRPRNEATVSSISQRFDIRQNDRVIVFPGQYQQHKNHITLFKAVKEIGDTSIRLICSGSEFRDSLTTILRSAIKELDLERQIFLTGHLTDEDLSALFHRADLIVSPSLAEGGAYIAQEGILYKKNVCVSRIRPAMMHVKVMNASIPTFDPLDVSEMASAISFSLAHPQDNTQALEVILGWTWEKLALQYAEVIHWVGNGCSESQMPGFGPESLGMALAN
jgi:glycosyltransferase involved in cell wall biosynthesis